MFACVCVRVCACVCVCVRVCACVCVSEWLPPNAVMAPLVTIAHKSSAAVVPSDTCVRVCACK
jgi:hypothetical protein